jgi:ectoine hydroxylase-related dioxygenase (phytanoyl-CoA dioxygenase family)
VKLPDVIPPDVVAALAVRLDELLATHFGGDTDGRFLSLEMMWRTDSLMRLAALSPRLGGIAATLLDEPAVRLYHDNALSKQPGCGRTPWHHDADHFPLDSTRVCTSWLPLHPVPVSMGPLAFAPGVAPSALGELPSERDGTAYDIAVAAWLDAHGARIAADPFALGDVSFHASSCLHTAGANHTTAPRRVLSNTYMADGARVIARPTALSGAWQDFMPGVGPGDLAASACNPVVGRSQ